jgi:transcriptional regulator with XRE-family HTH domain
MRKNESISSRAVPHVRTFLAQRLRALRRERGLSQEDLGKRCGLSGKFIGEVERAVKSISVDSLYHIAAALNVPLELLTRMESRRNGQVPPPEAEAILAMVMGRPTSELKRARQVLETMLRRSA